MKDELKRLLDPADDGRAFTDAVLFKASGALHRRLQSERDELAVASGLWPFDGGDE